MADIALYPERNHEIRDFDPDGNPHHSVYTFDPVKLTVNNKGTITAGTGNYALLFYGNSTVVFNAYASSKIVKSNMGACVINNGPSAHAKLVTFNVAPGAHGVGNGTYYGMTSTSDTRYECKLVINLDQTLQA